MKIFFGWCGGVVGGGEGDGGPATDNRDGRTTSQSDKWSRSLFLFRIKREVSVHGDHRNHSSSLINSQPIEPISCDPVSGETGLFVFLLPPFFFQIWGFYPVSSMTRDTSRGD